MYTTFSTDLNRKEPLHMPSHRFSFTLFSKLKVLTQTHRLSLNQQPTSTSGTTSTNKDKARKLLISDVMKRKAAQKRIISIYGVSLANRKTSLRGGISHFRQEKTPLEWTIIRNIDSRA